MSELEFSHMLLNGRKKTSALISINSPSYAGSAGHAGTFTVNGCRLDGCRYRGNRTVVLDARGEANIVFSSLLTTCTGLEPAKGKDGETGAPSGNTPAFILGPHANVLVQGSMISGNVAKGLYQSVPLRHHLVFHVEYRLSLAASCRPTENFRLFPVSGNSHNPHVSRCGRFLAMEGGRRLDLAPSYEWQRRMRG